MSELIVPIVPELLQPYMDADFIKTHQRWQELDLHAVKDQIRPEFHQNEYGKAAIFAPQGDYDENQTVVLGLPHQQAMKPSMVIRAEYMRQQMAPDGRLIVLPNNTFGDSNYYSFNDQEAAIIAGGSLRPFFDNRTRLLEKLDVDGEVELTGFSLGGLTALGIASVGSNRFNVSLVNADDAPNTVRTPQQLQKDFLKSGGFGDQRQAIADSDIPVLGQALNMTRLLADYGRFGLAAGLTVNRTMRAGIAGVDANKLVAEAIARQPDIAIKIGYIAGSHVFKPEAFDLERLRADAPSARLHLAEYAGEATHLHPTGDNIAATTLMLAHARDLTKEAA